MAVINGLVAMRANVRLAALVVARNHIVTSAATDVAITLLDGLSAIVASAVG